MNGALNGRWTYGQCTFKRYTTITKKREYVKRLNKGVETVKGFSYLGNVLSASGGSEKTVVV